METRLTIIKHEGWTHKKLDVNDIKRYDKISESLQNQNGVSWTKRSPRKGRLLIKHSIWLFNHLIHYCQGRNFSKCPSTWKFKVVWCRGSKWNTWASKNNKMQSFYLDGCKKSKQTDLKDEALQKKEKKETRTTTASSTKTRARQGCIYSDWLGMENRLATRSEHNQYRWTEWNTESEYKYKTESKSQQYY